MPPSLTEKLEAWRPFFESGAIEPWMAGYSPSAWLMVLQGLQVFDHSNLAKNYEKTLPIGLQVLNINEAKYKNIVAPHWTIEEWLKRTA